MAVVLAQVDATLVLTDPDSGFTIPLDLPDGVTIDSTKKPSIAVLKRGAAIVWSPSRNLMLTPDRVLILLAPAKPSTSTVAATGAAGVLTGAYQYAFSFIRKDAAGNVITESAMSALSNVVNPVSQQVGLTSIDVSTDTDTVTGRRLYRTLSGGTILYFLADIADNTTTTYTDNAADATLSVLPENSHRTSEIGGTNASDTYKLRMVVSWKNRLWAVTNNPEALDMVLYTEDGKPYRWGNELPAFPEGQELHGIVAMAPRRNELGVMKRGGLWQITGDSNLSFRIVQIGFGRGGCLSERSVVTINDEAFWHGPDGVNHWGSGGVDSITDKSTRPWFMTDRYFNRDEFANSFAKFNEIRDQYELHLCAPGQTVSTYWVAFNRNARVWYGPHYTTEANLTCAARVENEDGVARTIIGATNGRMYTFTPETYHDGTTQPIVFFVKTPKYNGDEPDVEHMWLELDVLTKVEDIPGTLTVAATLEHVERDEAADTVSMAADLSMGRERCGRVGKGATVQLEFTQAALDQPCTLLGFELPFHEVRVG